MNFQMFGCLVAITLANFECQASTKLFVLIKPFRQDSYEFHISGGNNAGVARRRPRACLPLTYVFSTYSYKGSTDSAICSLMSSNTLSRSSNGIKGNASK